MTPDHYSKRALFQGAFEHAALGFIVSGVNGQILAVNPAACRMLGYDEAELLATDLQAITHMGDREVDVPGLQDLLTGEAESFTVEKRYLRKSGDSARVQQAVSLVRDAKSHPQYFVSQIRDVTRELRQVNQKLQEKELQLSAIVDNIGDGLITFDAHGIVHAFNAAACAIFGYTTEQVIGTHIDNLITENLREARTAEIDAHLGGGDTQLVGKGKLVMPALRKDGTVFHIELIVNAIETAQGGLFVAVLRDVTERRKAEFELFNEKERLRVTLNSIGDGVITSDTTGRVTYLNPVAERMTGWSTEEAKGVPLSRVLVITEEGSSEPAPDPVEKVLLGASEAGLAENTILEHRGGGRFAIEDSAAAIRNSRDDVIGAVLVFHDVSESRRIAAEMTHQASHDSLTGLLNRRGFERRLDTALKKDRENHGETTVLFMDLDQFKVVNDTSGHAAGDELLRQLAGIFRQRLRQADSLARLGGDEFAVILENCATEAAMRIAEGLQQAIAQFPFVWEGRTFHVGVSIGMVLVQDGAITRPEVLRQADAACYLAKDRGRNRIHVYKSDDRHRTMRHGEMGWIARIHQALQDDRFLLCRQASVALMPAETPHFEILVRMLEPDGQLVMPNSFIPSAERYGLMPEIDRWVIHAALTKLGIETRHSICFINLSGASVGDDTLAEYVEAQIKAAGVNATDVCFEITETAAIGNLVHAEAMIMDMKDLGCRFALDDFGSGMSSFAYLKHLPVDYLKIDGAFVRHMDTDPIDRAMVEAINNIGHVMGIETIAEYVENQATVELLAGMGVDYAQGYWIEKPRPWT
jgi:diguanylate cyclase (GGDEF)-like protein/PAS domain S-box-containing protein